MLKTNIKYFLFLCLIALSCSSAGGDGEGQFMQIDFNSLYTDINSAKEFSFDLSTGGTISDSGENCVAVTWGGHLNKNDYYGFAVEKDNFHLILYFPQQGITFETKSLTPAPEGAAPAFGQYIAVMRYGNRIYKNPQNPITLDIQNYSTADGDLTKIDITTSIIFNTPASITVTQNGPMVLKPY